MSYSAKLKACFQKNGRSSYISLRMIQKQKTRLMSSQKMFLRHSIRIITQSTKCMTTSDFVSIFSCLIFMTIVEYKRKVYLDQKREKSDSPVRHSISTSHERSERTAKDLLSPNKNFLTHLPATSHDIHVSVDTTA